VLTFIIRRMLWTVLVLFVITVVVFVIFFKTPGVDPARAIAGRNPSAQVLQEIREQFGLDKPLPVQYGLMMKSIFISRDLVSYSNQGVKVVPEIAAATPATLSLVFGAALIWVVMAIAVGVAAALLRGTVFDPLLMVLALIGVSAPVFWVGEVANLITQGTWHDTFLFSWVPPLGYTPLTQNPGLWFRGLVIPWITLSILYIGLYGRVLRANILETQNEDFVRTARAKGITERQVLLRHTLRTSMITFVSLFGLDFGALVAGRGAAHRGGVRHPRGRLPHLSGPGQPRPADDHGHRGVRGVLHRAGQHHRRHRLRLARSEDPAHMTGPHDGGAMTGEPLLDVRDLKVSFRTEDGLVKAVDGVSLTLFEGETLGIVGESGSGKSVTMMSVMRLINDPNARFEGEVLYKGRDLMTLNRDQMRTIRGTGIAMIFQDPMTSLNPVYRVGGQIAEQIRAHDHVSKQAARARAVELLAAVGIPQAAERVDNYPHEFSGGMRQRVMIAMAVSCNPDVLIADEPTTALDVTIQAQILKLLRKLKDDFGTAVVLITHDMGVVADLADRIAVMYAGRIVEQGTRREVFYDAQHPYTWGLLGSIARLDRPKPRRLAAIPGQPPSLLRLSPGCAFADRCAHRFDLCDEPPPLLARVDGNHLDACHLEPKQKKELRETTIHPELIENAE
jgi:peptide/nickel transport system ATP-binding protein/oligopeptide transport system ATP-binding protein